MHDVVYEDPVYTDAEEEDEEEEYGNGDDEEDVVAFGYSMVVCLAEDTPSSVDDDAVAQETLDDEETKVGPRRPTPELPVPRDLRSPMVASKVLGRGTDKRMFEVAFAAAEDNFTSTTGSSSYCASSLVSLCTSGKSSYLSNRIILISDLRD